MTGNTILYVSDTPTSSAGAIAAIQADGHEVVTANNSNQALALLFVMHSAVAVILDLRTKEKAAFKFARELRAIHPGVPILLRCCDHIDHLSSCVDAYVSLSEPLEKFVSVLRSMFKEEPAVYEGQPSDHLAGAL
jgi:DNA-binding NtrC family response regulator